MVSIPDENTTLNDCFRDKKDWRACKDEVSLAESVEAGSGLPLVSATCAEDHGNDEKYADHCL